MQAMNRLALTIAGRRVVQPFYVRNLRVSTRTHSESIPDVSLPPAPRDALPPQPTKKNASNVTRKKTKAATKQSKRTGGQKTPPEKISGDSGFTRDTWNGDWGKDELAPPSSKKRRAGSKRRPRKENVPANSQASSSRALPPHRIPYVRRTEGYISDDTEKCTTVLRDVESPSEHKPIAQLAHGLDRVLFNPGIYWLRDPRSRIYNFTPWLESIPSVTDFAFERVTGFVKSSMDNDLWKVAKQHKRPFAGSTSSLTGLLSHCYFLISGDKDVDTSLLSRGFSHQPTNFTPGQRMPTSVVLNHKEGVWLIDSDKTEELAEKNVLTWMGTMLEKFLTVSEGEFKKLLRSSPVSEEDADTRREAYRYAMSDRFVMRSQLDCVDSRLPGTGVFDIKTRAALPIRLDILNYEENSGYLIKSLTGPLESFEREYYDLIRSAFLKYSFQARIGNMDGVLVAYHNTARIFGFQYVSLEEMEERLYGSGNGTRIFNKCVSLLERVLSDAVSIYGERSVRCTFETRELSQELNVWIQPVEWDDEAEGKPCPITELDVRVTNFLDGKEVKGSKAVADGRGWVAQWTLTEAALDQTDIQRRLEAARERQFTALSFPAGITTLEEMEKVWAKIDFGGKHSAQEMMAAMTQLASRPATSEGQSEDVDDAVGATPASSFPSAFLTFREPDKSIRQLRQLAQQGREKTLQEEAEGREKVVWGSVEEGDCAVLGDGTLPTGTDDRSASAELDGIVVSVGDGCVTRSRES
ncbi:hypothetical protein JVU11DRAFT_3055 [Chiua virens]|nr:hypothetical protein JVU11DRAFT_3055 [Chiua virens]